MGLETSKEGLQTKQDHRSLSTNTCAVFLNNVYALWQVLVSRQEPVRNFLITDGMRNIIVIM
jgi:hypothetical protein